MSGWLLAMMLATVGPVADTGSQSQTITLTWDVGAKTCDARVGGIEIGDPLTDEGTDALLRALPDKGQRIQLNGTMAIPYKCVGGLVEMMRHKGYRRITFSAGSPAR